MSDPVNIQRVSIDSREVEELVEYEQVEFPLDGRIYNYSSFTYGLQAGSNGTVWETVGLYDFDIDEETGVCTPILRRLDKDGKELFRTEFDRRLQENLGLGTLRQLMVDGDGDIFARCGDGFALLDEKGEPVFSVGTNGANMMMEYGVLAVLGDGRIGVLTNVFVGDKYVCTVSAPGATTTRPSWTGGRC